MITLDWKTLDSDIIIPKFEEKFAIASPKKEFPEGGNTWAFFNPSHRFPAVKRTALKNVTVNSIHGEIHHGTNRVHLPRAALITSQWWRNYSHFLVDMLPMLKILEDVDFQHLILPPNRAAKQILSMMNIPAKVHFLDKTSAIGVGELWLVSPLSSPSIPPAWAVDYLRSQLMSNKATQPPKLRLWIERSDTGHRQLVTGDHLYGQLRERDFVPIVASNYSIQEQIDLFAQAQVIAGVHGAGFTNIIFSQPGITLLELFDPYWVNGIFRILAGYRSMQWHYECGDAYADSAENVDRDVHITQEKILTKLDRCLSLADATLA